MDEERSSAGAGVEVPKRDPATGRSTTVVKEKCYRLLKFEELPDHLRTNEFILRYYRSGWPFKQALSSLFAIHNETLNIWTHVLGFLFFLGLTTYTAVQLPNVVDFSRFPTLDKIRSTVEMNITTLVAPFSPTESRIARWPFFVFLGGAMTCLLFSSSYHLLNCHSKRWHSILHRFDHAGIAILIAASFYPPVYYTFICQPVLRNSYLVAISTLGVCTILFSCLPMFRTPAFRPLRALMFFGMGVSGVVPGIHRVYLFQNEPAAAKAITYEIAMGSFYGLGALLYASRIPERLKPGLFDIVGHSHQIFHILVVAGACTHYQAALLDLQWRGTQGCP